MTSAVSPAAAERIAGPQVVCLDGHAGLSREVLGNKGYGIDSMSRHGFPVPPAFCITTDAHADWSSEPSSATLHDLREQVRQKMSWLESQTGRTFGGGPRALLVSVRSGAAQSMPGMLDTVLNLGINDSVEQILSQQHGQAFAADTHERFRTMYRRIVLGGSTEAEIPDDPYEQLRGAISAVFQSWGSPRAVAYRQHHGIDDSGGTAVTVQAMVFGNLEHRSGTGVLFSRNPMTGASEPFGEWLRGGQGEDVVSGTSDVEPIDSLRTHYPDTYDELMAAAQRLEQLGTDVQDIEFTIEGGRLWLLQTRNAKRSAQAAVRLALQFHHEGLIDDAEAVRRVTPEHIRALLKPALQPETRLAAPLLAKGSPACPGVASGRAYTDIDAAIDAAEAGEAVILVRNHTSPDDVAGMVAAHGVVTEIGGATSHAAVVSRELGRPSVVGCGEGVAARLEGLDITVDGIEGEIREGILDLQSWSEQHSADLRDLADIAQRVSPLRAHHDGDHPRLDGTSSSEEVAHAVANGVTDVLSDQPLLTMLVAVHSVGLAHN